MDDANRKTGVELDLSGSRQRSGSRLAAVGLVIVVALWRCGGMPTPPPTPTPTPAPVTTDCGPAMAPLQTRVVVIEATVSWVETLAAEMLPTCGALWDCCANATGTAAAPTGAPEPGPWPTYTPYPSPSAVPDFCRRCIANMAEPFGCPPGYVCEACDPCRWLCVPAGSPRSGCNFCLSLVIP